MITEFVGVLCLIVYLALIHRLNFWKYRNVPFVPATIFSSVTSLFYNPTSFFEHYAQIYHQLRGHKFGGCFWNFQPQLVVRDPELIKCILTKDFEYFRDRGNVIYDDQDPLTKHLFSAPGDLWKALRVRLTPTFTSGKMKYMFNTVKECAEDYQKVLENLSKQGTLIDFKEIGICYAMDVINTTAFGWKTNSMDDPNLELRKISRTPIRGTLRFRLRQLFYVLFPFLKGHINISTLPTFMRQFFFKIVGQTVEYRRQSGYQRKDFLQLLMALNEQNDDSSDGLSHSHSQYELELTNELTAAQCFIFFFGGFDTSSMVIAMTLLELAMNANIQKKLQKEIDEAVTQNGGQVTYDLVKDMPYLHKVVQETMRKYPLFPILSRICTKMYQLPETNIIIDKGTEVIIPVSGIHRDVEFYENPEIYDPERFNDQVIKERHNYVYLPFGEGPRNCIGSRFALMTVKLGIIHIFNKFNLVKSSKTTYPTFSPYKLVTSCYYPVLLECFPRNQEYQ